MSETAAPEALDTARFDLFISYASEDRWLKVAGRQVALVRELKRRLEAHRLPDGRRFRVCSYEEDFELSDTVDSAIREKIREARAGLILCSEESRSNRYVRRELELFLEEGKELIPAFLNVLPEDAFPEFFAAGTLAANLQPEAGASIREWKSQLESESHKIVAKAAGLDRSEVHDRFEIRRRKVQRWLVAAGVAALLVVGLAVWQSRQSVLRQRHNEAVDALEAGGFTVSASEAGSEIYDVSFDPPEEVRLADENRSEAFVAGVTELLARADDLIQVRRVEVRRVPLGDAALERLGMVKELEELSIGESTITDAGLEHLVDLTGLRTLDLQDTRLTDAGLSRLSGLAGLRSLTLGSTLVTDAGRERLAQSLPECEMTLAPHEIAIRKVRESLTSFGILAEHRDGSGFQVVEVREASPATVGGVASGAVIRGINGAPVVRRRQVIPVSETLRELQCSLDLEGQPAPVVLASTLAGFQVFRSHPEYDHDRFGTEPRDILLEFRAFVSSFDGPDDDDGDGLPDIRATPEWVASEVRRVEGEPEAGNPGGFGPSFETDDLLNRRKLAPAPEAYRGFGFDRGHLYSPRFARRIDRSAVAGAGYVVNLAPQTPNLNRITWNTLEKLTTEWVESYGSLWVVTGPVYYRGVPAEYIQHADDVAIAIPNAFYKILVREEEDDLLVLPFLFPQAVRRVGDPEGLLPYLTSVDAIEALTGLDFFTRLPEDEARKIETQVPAELWPVTEVQ